MLKLSRAALVFLISLSFLTLSQGASAADSLDKLMALSGLTKQVKEYPGVIKAGIHASYSKNPTMPYGSVQELMASADKAFVPGQILATTKKTLADTLSDDEVSELLTWYESDLGKKITREEEKASTPEAYEDMSINGHTLMGNQERVAMAKRLEDIINATDLSMALQEYTALAVYSALMPGQAGNMEALKQNIVAQLAQARPQMEQNVLMSLVYSHRNLDLAELKKYQQFLAKPAAKKFNRAAMQGIKAGMEDSINDWVKVFEKMRADKAGKP